MIICSKCQQAFPRLGQRYCNDCHAEYMRENRPKHIDLSPEAKMKANSRAVANMAQQRGRLIPQPCCVCGSMNEIEKHHPDHLKPLEVVWYCRQHHIIHHETEKIENYKGFLSIINKHLKEKTTMQMRDYLEQSSRTAQAEPKLDLTLLGTDAKVLDELLQLAVTALKADYMKRTLFYSAHNKASDHLSAGYDRLQKLQDALDKAPHVQLISDEINILHAVLGVMSEMSEVAEALILAVTSGKRVDVVNMTEEAGDSLWYNAMLLRAIGSTFEDAARVNINKLAKRYPVKFSTEHAVNRDLQAERETLEKAVSR